MCVNRKSLTMSLISSALICGKWSLNPFSNLTKYGKIKIILLERMRT